MEMEVDKLSDFLKNCCRVCLSVENEMIDSSNIVENFNKSIDQLLFECANLKVRIYIFLRLKNKTIRLNIIIFTYSCRTIFLTRNNYVKTALQSL